MKYPREQLLIRKVIRLFESGIVAFFKTAFVTTNMVFSHAYAGLPSHSQSGSIDPSFISGLGTNVQVRSIALSPESKIYVLCNSSDASFGGSDKIVRLNPSGSIDSSFDTGLGVEGYVSTMAIQADGKVLIGGGFSKFNGTPRNRIARLNSNGAVDNSFDAKSGPDGEIRCITLQADGRILIGGPFNHYQGVHRVHVARLNRDGGIDPSFVPRIATDTWINAIAQDRDGNILIGGGTFYYTPVIALPEAFLKRLNPDGSLDSLFIPDIAASIADITSLVLQRDDKLLVAGYFASDVRGYEMELSAVARMNHDGSRDLSFHIPVFTGLEFVIPGVDIISLQSNDKILVGGYFQKVNGTNRCRIARLNPDGTLDTDFDVGFLSQVGSDRLWDRAAIESIVLQQDGKVLIGGLFSHINGIPNSGIARLNGDRLCSQVLLTPEILPSKHCMIHLRGQPGLNFSLEASTNLIDWIPLITTNSADYSWEWIDPESVAFSQRFYRIVTETIPPDRTGD